MFFGDCTFNQNVDDQRLCGNIHNLRMEVITKLDEEKLREAACYGDIDAVSTLLKKGVNINAQHSINGW